MLTSARTRHALAIGLAASLLLAGAVGLLTLLQRERLPLLQRIERAGVLVVATRRGPTTYHQGPQGADGFEYALVRQFARDLGVEVRFVFPDTIDELLDATARGAVHLAAAGLCITAERQKHLDFSDPYEYASEQLIYRRGSKRPRSLAEIGPGEIQVIADSGHEHILRQLRDTAFPELSWQRVPGVGVQPLLSALDQGLVKYTVASSNEAELSRRLYRYASTAFELGEPLPLAWAIRKTDDHSLLDAINAFLGRTQQDGRLQRLHARYYGHAGRMNFVETRQFWRNVRDRLPALRGHFEHAAEITGIDWRLLAAIAYQESNWRVDAVSPTGVRGVMMLTQSTARQMAIKDRDDPQQSIVGGAKYLRIVENKIPARIQEPNRLWLTLAGYNIGFGHLEDARILTERDGANPDLWLEVKQRLPLLARKEYYSTVRRGFARGQEPVDYVDNIRNFYDLLVWYTTTSDYETRDRLLVEDKQ
ncbi:MAG: membrane-bound lytic murein transglycosylase MltF [Chromatiaceae bacterium]|jgi:membrane-bound lytic murein transglycosylase F|nr:membrane-bound lytic murein transglycosylase MltF [Chromatiaceae bacterium]